MAEQKKSRDLCGDDTIVSLFFARDENALSETKRKYGHLFRSIAMNLLGDPSDAEECENDAYFRLWNSIPPEKPVSLPAYGCRIVRNLAIDRIRSENAQKRISGIREELDEAIPDKPDGAFEYGELVTSINSFLRTCSKQERVFFLRRYFFGDGPDDIAAMFDVSASAVKSQLFRTREKLKTYLKGEGYEL